MRLVTRRAFIGAGASMAIAALGFCPRLHPQRKSGFKVGVTDWNLKLARQDRSHLPCQAIGVRWGPDQVFKRKR